MGTTGDWMLSEKLKLSWLIEALNCRRGVVFSGIMCKVGFRLAMFVSMGVPCKFGVLNSEKVRDSGIVSLSSNRLAGGACG